MTVLSSNNQITVPASIRRLKGWGAGTELDIVIDAEGIVRIVTPDEASEMFVVPLDELVAIRELTRKGLGRAKA